MRLLRCARCGLVFREGYDRHAFADEYLNLETQTAYFDQLYMTQEAGIRSNFQYILSVIERFAAGRRGRILDYGCATGLLLDEARKSGWVPVGFEISPYAAAFARDRLQLEVFTDRASLNGQYSGQIDVIVLSEVLEHLLEPIDLVTSLAPLLSPGGFIFLSTPNWNSLVRAVLGSAWEVAEPAGHLFLFSLSSLRALLAHAGFDARAVWTRGCRFLIEERFRGLCGPLLEWVETDKAQTFFASPQDHDPLLHRRWKRCRRLIRDPAGGSPEAFRAGWRLASLIAEKDLGETLMAVIEPRRKDRIG